MPYEFTQDELDTMEAGSELDERVCIAIEYFLAANASWSWPSLYNERIRRHLGLPNPFPGSYPTYAGPAFSSDTDLMQDLFADWDLTYTGSLDAETMAKWFVKQAMISLGMD